MKSKDTFLGVRTTRQDKPVGDVVFIGAPSEAGCVFRKGTAAAPGALRQASKIYAYPGYCGSFDPEGERYILEDAVITDAGDLARNGLHEKICGCVKRIARQNGMPVLLGGDHSVTYGAIQAIAAVHGACQIVHLDAHSDYQRLTESDASPCGTVMRRINDIDGVVRVVHVGLRGYLNSGAGIADSKARGNGVITCNELKSGGPKAVLSHMIRDIPCYVTFDADFLDPSVCAGTTVPEHGGPTFTQAEQLMVSIACHSNVVGFDCVEYNPRYDSGSVGGFALVRLIMSTIGASHRPRSQYVRGA